MNTLEVSMHATNLQSNESSTMKPRGRWDGARQAFGALGATHFYIRSNSIQGAEPETANNRKADARRELIQPLLGALFQLEGNAR